MRFVDIPLPPNLPKKWMLSCDSRTAGIAACSTAKDRAVYTRKHGSWRSLKNWLAKANGSKCWYCESKSIRAPFDVDHFRPKLGVTVDGNELAGHDGYWWLAYEWSNFRLSCQRCNRSETEASFVVSGKAKEFALLEEADRCRTPSDQIESELPRLLDPCNILDCELLTHTIDGEVKPAADPGTCEYIRAEYTIKVLGLNNWELPKSKRDIWGPLNLLIKLNANQAEVVSMISACLERDQEYLSYLRASIGGHREKQWIQNLL